MALIRQVLQSKSGRWGYVEYSDENNTHSIELGQKNFATKEEAEEYSKGFDSFSYTWVNPVERKKKELQEERKRLVSRIEEIDYEWNKLFLST